MNAADRFREIDNLAGEVRRALDNGGDRATAGGYLVAIQTTAQNGLREALADQPKLAAFDELLAACVDVENDLATILERAKDAHFRPLDSLGIHETQLMASRDKLVAAAKATKQTGEPT